MADKTKQELEAAINRELIRFLKERLGEEARFVASEALEDTIIVRFKGVLPLAERHLCEDPRGARLIHELKMKLIEEVKPSLEALIEDLTGARVVDTHSSFNLASGERIEIFTLNKGQGARRA